MAAPPVPPRPASVNQNPPPPRPPLPPDILQNRYSPYESPPHFDNPLIAPRPHKLDPTVPANMVQNLNDELYRQQQDYRRPSPAPPPPPPPGAGVNYTPGFAAPPSFSPNSPQWSPWNQQAPPTNNGGYSSPPPTNYAQPPPNNYAQPPPNNYAQPPPNNYAQPPPNNYTQPPPNNYAQPPPNNYAQPPPNNYSQQPPANNPYSPPPSSLPYPGSAQNFATPDSLSQNLASLSFSPQQQQPPRRPQSAASTFGPPPKAPSPPRTSVPSLTAPIPTIAWARDVLFLVDKLHQNTSNDTPIGPIVIPDPNSSASLPSPSRRTPDLSQHTTPPPAHVAEAIYLRATFEASGAYPDQAQHNPRSAFRDFEAAARAGYAAAWFRLGRDYENFNDAAHAKECFERGVKLGVESCAYRMGMANLMGQLGLPASQELAVPLLHRAATLASLDVPQPAYVYALLLLNEFSHVTIPASLFAPFIPPSSSATLEARKHLERAAYLNFAPAQYKLGHAYEFAQPPFPFDALLSVQYYSLASQQGEVEADMALSKWFLCGSGEPGQEGGFDKDESLAWTFADKAARKGLPSAEFAMGYYAEVGVGGPKDLQIAIKWYTKARDHGNADAAERLVALSQPSPQALSRQEHDTITDVKLVRKRTQAKQRSEALPAPGLPYPGTTQGGPGGYGGPGPAQGYGGRPGPQHRPDGRQVVDNVRKSSMMAPAFPSGPGPGAPSAQAGRLPSMPEYPQSYSPPGTANSTGVGPRPKPQQFPGSNRYTLTDSPVPPGGPGAPGPAQGGGRTQSPGGRPAGAGRGGGRIVSGGTGAGGPPPAAPAPVSTPKPAKPGKPGPTTFAEMGIQGAKAEEKECVIM
ncbi:hypothetical protein BD779DRAFT_1678416 [Infundibulicybe gibba]|nr:hypothetical protein BD779DRAFT_1678416 [Infundibulicybe gibba]